MKALKFYRSIGAALVTASLVPAVSFAASPYAAITTAVDWDDVVTGVVAIAALIAAVLVSVRGAKMLLRMIGT